MKLKKTVTLMLIAGILTASLASCVVKGDDGPNDKGGTEPYLSVTTEKPEEGTPPPAPVNDPSQITYTTADEPAYTISNASLKKVDNVSETITLGELTELRLVGKHVTWSKVEYNGTLYYIATALITTDDLMEKNFQSVNKQLYVNVDSVYVRKYPSANNSFSTVLGSRKMDDQVKVIAQNASWSKIEWTENGSTKYGFISTDCLSVTKGTVNEEDYIQNFTRLSTPTTMYVATSQVNLRKHPYADNKISPIVITLNKGNAVTVVAEGTVDGDAWYAVEWTENSVKSTCYVWKDYLSKTSGSATLAEILDQYDELVEFDEAKTLYICENQAKGRSAPTRVLVNGEENVVKILVKRDSVTVVASGKIEGKDPNGAAEEIVWGLVKDDTLGYYFVSMSVLTSDPNGEPSAPVLSLDELINTYGFSELTNGAVSMKTKEDVKPWAAPNTDKRLDDVTIASGTTVQVLAQGTTASGLVNNDWYIIQYDGAYYFVIQNLLSLA